jgi:hypothetical protein
VDELARGPHGCGDASGCCRRWVSGAAFLDGYAHHPPCLAADHVHVQCVGSHVFGGDVAPLERVDDPPVRAPQAFRLHLEGVADDDGLAATEVQSCCCRLEAHGLGEAEDVYEGFLLGLVRIETGPAEGGTEIRRVDCDDALEARGRVRSEDDLLVLSVAQHFEYTHGLAPFEALGIHRECSRRADRGPGEEAPDPGDDRLRHASASGLRPRTRAPGVKCPTRSVPFPDGSSRLPSRLPPGAPAPRRPRARCAEGAGPCLDQGRVRAHHGVGPGRRVRPRRGGRPLRVPAVSPAPHAGGSARLSELL